MESLGTFLLYCLAFALMYALARMGEKRKREKYIVWAYVLFFLMTVLRYDVGNDYRSYYTTIEFLCGFLFGDKTGSDIWNLYMLEIGNEPSYLVFCWLFHWFKYPSLLVIGTYSLIGIYFFYKTFEEYNVHSIAFILFFVTGFLFWYWDLIRQSVSLAIFFYSLKYIRYSKPWKYILFTMLGMFFHYSAVFMLPLYLMRYVKLKQWIYVSVILLAVVAMYTGVNFDNVFNYIGDLPFYESYAYDKRIGDHYEGFGYKLRLTCYALAGVFAILKLPKVENYLKGILTLGVVMMIVSMGNLLVDRIAVYMFYSIIIAYSVAMRNSKGVFSIAGTLLIVAMFILSGKSVLDGSDRGCSPYQTVFSEDFQYGRFKDKKWL